MQHLIFHKIQKILIWIQINKNKTQKNITTKTHEYPNETKFNNISILNKNHSDGPEIKKTPSKRKDLERVTVKGKDSKRGNIIDKPVENEKATEMAYFTNNVHEEDGGSNRPEEDIENKNEKQDI